MRSHPSQGLKSLAPPTEVEGFHPPEGPNLGLPPENPNDDWKSFPSLNYSSAPNLVRCYHESRLRVNENFILELRRLWESARGNHLMLARATDANFTIHCLFTVIHCYSLFFLAAKNRECP